MFYDFVRVSVVYMSVHVLELVDFAMRVRTCFCIGCVQLHRHFIRIGLAWKFPFNVISVVWLFLALPYFRLHLRRHLRVIFLALRLGYERCSIRRPVGSKRFRR